MILEFDRSIFLLLNNAAGKSPWLDFLIQFLGSTYLILIGGIAVLLWYLAAPFERWQKVSQWRVDIVFKVLMSVILSRFIITELIRFFVDRQRPFEVIASVQQIIAQSPGHSFPSGHAVVAFAIAASLGHHFPRLRFLLWSIAVLTGLARIAGGVHWPSDVIVGAIIGVVSGWIVERIINFLWRIKKPLEN